MAVAAMPVWDTRRTHRRRRRTGRWGLPLAVAIAGVALTVTVVMPALSNSSNPSSDASVRRSLAPVLKAAGDIQSSRGRWPTPAELSDVVTDRALVAWDEPSRGPRIVSVGESMLFTAAARSDSGRCVTGRTDGSAVSWSVVAASVCSAGAGRDNGTHRVDRSMVDAVLQWGSALAIAPDGSVVIADPDKHRVVRRTSNDTFTELASLSFAPSAVGLDRTGVIYLADPAGHRLWRLAPGGVPAILAGAASTAGVLDGVGPAARFTQPQALALGASGTVYLADVATSTIRRVEPAGLTSTLPLPAATQLETPSALAVDPDGRVALVDLDGARLRVLDGVAPLRTLTVDGTIRSIAVSSAGDLYVLEVGDGRWWVELISHGEMAGRTDHPDRSTLADGPVTAPRLPVALAVDDDGSVVLL